MHNTPVDARKLLLDKDKAETLRELDRIVSRYTVGLDLPARTVAQWVALDAYAVGVRDGSK